MKKNHISQNFNCVDEENFTADCMVRQSDSDKSILLIGDSQADALSDGVSIAAAELNLTLFVSARSGCPFIMQRSSDSLCDNWRRTMMRKIRTSDYKVIIISNRSNGYSAMEKSTYFEALDKALNNIMKPQNSVILVGSLPEPTSEFWRTFLGKIQISGLGKEGFAKTYDRQSKTLERQLKNKYPNIDLFQPGQYFCDESNCKLISKEGDILYLDAWHLSVAGSKLLGPKLEERIKLKL